MSTNNVRDISNFIQAIDKMDIFTKDYTTIVRLMDNLDDKLFVKILEEVLNGNLYWSDFEEIFNNTDYGHLLRQNITLQDKLNKDITNFIILRNELGFSTDTKKMNMGISYIDFSDEHQTNYAKEIQLLQEMLGDIIDIESDPLKNYINIILTSDIALMKTAQLKDFRRLLFEYVSSGGKFYKMVDTTKTETSLPAGIYTVIDNLIQYCDIRENAQFYRDEYENMRDNHLYNLTQFKIGDTLLTRTCKDRIYNAIMNGKYLEKLNIEFDEESSKNIIYDESGNKIGILSTEYDILLNNGNRHEYINIDDILLSLDHGIVPIAYDYQKLDDTDIEFMTRNNLTEDMMRQFKSLNLFLRRNEFIKKFKEDL